MEKNTILAVVFSSLVIFGWFLFIQPILYPPQEPEPSYNQDRRAPVESPVIVQPESGTVQPAAEETIQETLVPEEIPEKEERVVIETDLIMAVLSNSGGDLVSYRLKEHHDKGQMVEMILPSVDENGIERNSHAFTVAFGGINARPIETNFRISRPSPLVVEFSQDFSVQGYPEPFTLSKRYEFKTGEYVFQLALSITGPVNMPLNFGDDAYTLAFGPQIGPNFQKLDARYEYRHYFTLANGKKSNSKLNTVNDSRFTWAAIASKYFTVIVIPDNTLYSLSFSDKPEPGVPSTSRMYLIRPPLNSAIANDVFHFYLGPKNQESLNRYDTGDNGFKLRDLDITKAASTSGILSPLETFLKWLLNICYKLVKNYGVAIILLTLLVKIVLFPLTKKSSEASIKMQALAPKIKELQAKYKDNPAKLNTELSALYKKEGHNPMSGCLPLIIQMPLLFAMYNLFNNHFDLRGAMFIPGWIPDLSIPESILNFDSPLPLLGWEALRLLPFIYVASQLLYGFATRTPEQQGNPSMKMMLYVLPIVFFFVLYNVPSGLLVFWIMSNLFTLIQQVLLNKYLARKKAAAVEDEPPMVIAPRKKKKN